MEASSDYTDSLTTLFQDTQAEALQSLENGDLSSALQRFQENEELLESAKLRRVQVDEDFVLVTLHNLAYCHQQLQQTEMSASYLEACLYNVSLGRPVDYRRRKYECRARVQLCSLLSQLQRHEGALTHARLASKHSQSLLTDVQSLCFDHSNRHKKLLHAHRLKPLPEHLTTLQSASYRHSHDLVLKASPVLQLLQARLHSQPIDSARTPRLELRSALGVQHYDDWVYSVNIIDIVLIQPLTVFELKSSLEPFAELTRDFLLDKVCLLLASFYCLATELRLLYGRERLLQAHDYHSKALQLAKDLLPVECPLTEHLRASYHRHFQVLRRSKSPCKPRSKHKGDSPSPHRPRPSPPLTDRKPRKSKPTTPSPHTKSESNLPRKSLPQAPVHKQAETPLVSDSSQAIIITSSALYGSRAESPDWGGHQSPSIEVKKTKRRPEAQ